MEPKKKKKNKGLKPLSPLWRTTGEQRGGSQPARDPDTQREKEKGREREGWAKERGGWRRRHYRGGHAARWSTSPAQPSQREGGRSSEKDFRAPQELGEIPVTRALFRWPRWSVLVESIRCKLVRERWVEQEP